VWTSVGVIAGVGAVALTGWLRLDPLIALAVDANVVATGVALLRRSGSGLMDAALPQPQLVALERALEPYRQQGIGFHAIRTRQAGRRAFISLHVTVPGEWTVTEGHGLLDRLERDIRAAVPDAVVETHLEPTEGRPSAESRDLRDGRSPGSLRA
jgi:cation diffusion facilitator family transporter